MKVSTFLTIKAIASFIFAALELLAPATLISLMGGRAEPVTVYVMRTLGAAFVGIGLICWFTRNAARSALRQGVLLALFCADSVGFIVALWAQLAGLTNALHWAIVVIWLLLAAGLGYFRFLKPAD